MDLFAVFRSPSTALVPVAPPAPVRNPDPVRVVSRRALLSPRSGVRMLFGSADSNRLTGDWPSMPQPAEWIIAKHQRTLVARSREQAHNNDYMRAYLRLCRQNIVGAAGVMFQSKARQASGNPDKKAQQAIERWFADWGRRQHCDVAGKLSWRALQAHCVETAARDGEFFVLMVCGQQGGQYGFALQMLDPQRCPVDFDRFDLGNGHFIRSGIEFNAYARPIAYYFLDEDPQRASLGYPYGGKRYTRIRAEQIIHGFVAEMVGQKRGLPWLATGLFRMKQMGAFEDAAIVNARIGAAKMGFIEFAEGTGPQDNELDAGGLALDAEAGTFPLLPNGAKLNKFDPTYPSGEFAVFMKAMLRSLATGGGVGYHSLSQDLEGVNFSSIRQGTLDEREYYMQCQEWLVDELCARVIEAALPRAVLAGHIKLDSGRPLPAEHLDRYVPCRWQPRRWTWIDPRADVEASVAAKNNLLASPSLLIREQGKDPDEVWAQIGEDVKAMRAAGIPDEVIALSMGQKLAPAAPRPSEESEP